MKRLTIVFVLLSNVAFAQFGVSAHHSNLSFVGFNYEFADHLRPEVRIGTDNYFDDISLELIATYDILNKKEYEFYAGAGARFNVYEGMVIPIGLNVFPFESKSFGFHIELSPILFGEGGDILRGSWGIRYRFLNDKSDS